jgi:GTPase
MAQVYVKYNPYRLSTLIEVNGREIETDSTLYKLVKGKRLQEWIGEFPEMLTKELNTVDFEIEFCGMDLDWDDFEDAFQNAKKIGTVKTADLKYVEGQAAEDITQKIVDIFNDLQDKDAPIDDFRDPKLVRAFESVNEAEFPVNVIATMSSGKSTLINALLGKKLMPSKNEACTATITEILDNDKEGFQAVVYDKQGNVIRETDNLTYEVMSELNENNQVSKIEAEGDIPFLDAREIALMLVDTPGPNNSQNREHENITYSSVNNDSNSLILYVLNGTQLSTNDDNRLLSYVADQIKKGGKQVRDRFLFVINKMDGFNPEEEDIGKAIASAKGYLYSHGIEDPQIFPCSAFTALNIRSYLGGIDIDNLTRADERKLPSAARDTLPMIDKFIEYDSMHLEKYTTLFPSAQRELNYRLKQAQAQNDTKEQALIHCGICSIESAITAYVKKYAKTKKVKDLVETFQEVLESNKVLANAKEQIITDENAAKACAERAAVIREKISGGKEAQKFKEQIQALDPMKTINAKAKKLKQKAYKQVQKIFKPYGDTIYSKNETERLINTFAVTGNDSLDEMSAELGSVINHELRENGEQILIEYQEKLKSIDESAIESQLDFSTIDLIKGELTKMRENTKAWASDEFIEDTVNKVGEVEKEERSYYEKVGEEEEEVVVGSHEEKIGTEKVKVGSHRERTGTRTVRNPNKRWWKIFTPKYIEEDVYENVDDYEDRDIYKTVLDYKTIMRDVYEERTETIENYSADVSILQTGLLATLSKTLEDGMNSACSYAEKQAESMKKQFINSLEKLDQLITQKYEELEQCAKDQKTREEELKKSKDILEWIEANKNQIDSILDM